MADDWPDGSLGKAFEDLRKAVDDLGRAVRGSLRSLLMFIAAVYLILLAGVAVSWLWRGMP